MWTVNFLIYVFITAYTPGPNNLLSFGNAGTYGFRRSVPMLFGLLMSFLILMTVCALATSFFNDLLPQVMPYLTVVGAVYILWLALQLARSEPPKESEVGRVCTFWQAFLLNCLNVKVIVYGLTSYATFVLPYTTDRVSLIAAAIFLSLMGSSANCLWAYTGNALRDVFAKHCKAVNYTLALLLVYSVVTMFL